MFSVDMANLLTPLNNRGLSFSRNADGTVTVNGNVFHTASELENYLIEIPRTDIAGA